MFKDFNEFNFDVIDVSIQGSPDLYVNINGLTFAKKTIEDMNYPQFIRPLIDPANKAFAIQVCKQNDDKAIKFSKPRGEQQNGVNLQYNTLLKSVRAVMPDIWDNEHRYKITGIFYPEAKAMLFDLSTAEEMPAFRPLKGKESKVVAE